MNSGCLDHLYTIYQVDHQKMFRVIGHGAWCEDIFDGDSYELRVRWNSNEPHGAPWNLTKKGKKKHIERCHAPPFPERNIKEPQLPNKHVLRTPKNNVSLPMILKQIPISFRSHNPESLWLKYIKSQT